MGVGKRVCRRNSNFDVIICCCFETLMVRYCLGVCECMLVHASVCVCVCVLWEGGRGREGERERERECRKRPVFCVRKSPLRGLFLHEWAFSYTENGPFLTQWAFSYTCDFSFFHHLDWLMDTFFHENVIYVPFSSMGEREREREQKYSHYKFYKLSNFAICN